MMILKHFVDLAPAFVIIVVVIIVVFITNVTPTAISSLLQCR